MRAPDLTAMLAAFERRGAGTDAERRAANRLAAVLKAEGHRTAIETFWCRPNGALAHAWHVALALGGSLISVSQPTAGAVMLGAALVAIFADELTGVSPGRRLTPERASQNVVAVTGPQDNATTAFPGAALEEPIARTRLIITANYDAGRTALVYRDALRRPVAALRQAAGPLALGWLTCLSLTFTWALIVAILRATEHHASHTLGVIQLPPTVALVLALALLLEAAAAPYGPAANDNATGTAAAMALADGLSARSPKHLATELVLTGAGSIGVRHYLRNRDPELKKTNPIVLGLAPCGAGKLHYWVSDGSLIPLRYARALRELCARTPPATPHRGRGATPALAARARGLPAIAIGTLDSRGLAPRSHQPSDVPTRIEAKTLDEAVEFALRIADELDAALARTQPSTTPA